MTNFELYCITNIQSEKLEELNINLAGVGMNSFNKNYITCETGVNINEKEKHYSELTFHFWFWKLKTRLAFSLISNIAGKVRTRKAESGPSLMPILKRSKNRSGWSGRGRNLTSLMRNIPPRSTCNLSVISRLKLSGAISRNS